MGASVLLVEIIAWCSSPVTGSGPGSIPFWWPFLCWFSWIVSGWASFRLWCLPLLPVSWRPLELDLSRLKCRKILKYSCANVKSKGLTRYWPHCRACQYLTTFGLGCCSLCSPRSGLLRPLYSGPCLNCCCGCFHQISASDSSRVFHRSILFARHWLCLFFAGQSWPKLATTARISADC